MKKLLEYRLLLLPVLTAFILSVVTVLFLNRSFQLTASIHRNNFLSVIAEKIENRLNLNPNENPLNNIEPHHDDPMRGAPPPPPPPSESRRRFAPPPFPPPQANNRNIPPSDLPPPPQEDSRFMLLMWVVNSNGEFIFNNGVKKPPLAFNKINLPNTFDEVSETNNFFRTSRTIRAIKLNVSNKNLYLIVRDSIEPNNQRLFNSNAITLFLIVALAFSLSIIFIFFYLRKKANEAKVLLRKMASGDLKTRFPIKRFDEFGGLMLSFNEMAEEIDRLVSRLKEVESTRRTLLQELGHDLRTPLTSMRAATDTLIEVDTMLSTDQRHELYEVLSHDAKYLAYLLDQLIFLSSIDDPKYSRKREKISLRELLELEVSRRNVNSKIKWSLEKSERFDLFADRILLKRLFTNVLDNAARFAKKEVRVVVFSRDEFVTIEVYDDGPGFSKEALENFGVRKGFISRSSEEEKMQSHFGSLIMKKITKLYDGYVKAENLEENNKINGAKVSLYLKIS